MVRFMGAGTRSKQPIRIHLVVQNMRTKSLQVAVLRRNDQSIPNWVSFS
jgi:hypothetical protein